MMNIKIINEEDQNYDFYGIMGKHFASLSHKKELGGYQVYNKDKSTWFLLFDDNELLGFCVIFNHKTYFWLDNFIILKEFRNKGYSRFLFNFILQQSFFKTMPIKGITNNQIQIHNFEKHGFIKVFNKGSWIQYERS